MMYTDILVKENINNKCITDALITIFKVEFCEITVVNGIDNFPKVEDDKIICVKEIFEQGFKLLLSIYLAEQKIKNIPTLNKFSSDFAIAVNNDCLLPSETVNPYEMILFTKDGKEEIVYLDVDKYDNEELYFIDEKYLKDEKTHPS